MLGRFLNRISVRASKVLSALSTTSKSNAITRDDLTQGIIDIEINHMNGGFFAQINWCLYIFAYAKANSVVSRVSLVSRNYQTNPTKRDWFVDYFRYNYSNQGDQSFPRIRKKRISHFSELGFAISPDLTLQQARKIFFETVTIQDAIQEEVSDFVRRHFSGNRVLGIHYRGTDKVAEAPQVSYERVERCLCDLLETNQFSSIFVASDEQRFVDFLLTKDFRIPIAARDDSCRSLDGNPVHLRRTGSPENTLGIDAISNCMLLSQCHTVLRTSSFLGAWASIFNPDLRVYLLNRPYAATSWFPEREILKNAHLL